MTLFRSNNQREMWRERWCETCFQPQEAERRLTGKTESVCPIWERAIRTDRKPVQWDRNTRTDEVWRTIKCNEYTSRPRPVTKTVVDCDVPMFDVDETEQVGFVPVDGWPVKDKGVDHA